MRWLWYQLHCVIITSAELQCSSVPSICWIQFTVQMSFCSWKYSNLNISYNWPRNQWLTLTQILWMPFKVHYRNRLFFKIYYASLGGQGCIRFHFCKTHFQTIYTDFTMVSFNNIRICLCMPFLTKDFNCPGAIMVTHFKGTAFPKRPLVSPVINVGRETAKQTVCAGLAR